jgi:hypothetical protein
MSTLQEQLDRLISRKGEDSPLVQMLRNQIAAEKSGKSLEELYLTGSVNKGQKSSKNMGELIWNGRQTSAQDAPQPSQGESPSATQSSLELAAAAMRLKLDLNQKALHEQGIQSASEKIKQLNKPQK